MLLSDHSWTLENEYSKSLCYIPSDDTDQEYSVEDILESEKYNLLSEILLWIPAYW